jgi:hypothetical protein
LLSLLVVNSTVRMSEAGLSLARWTLRHWRRPRTPCFRACHSPSPRASIPVLATSKFKGKFARRNGIWTASVFCRRHSAEQSGTGQFRPASQASQAQKARNHSGYLPERQLEQPLDRQAELDRRIRENRRAPWTALLRRVPGPSPCPSRSPESRAFRAPSSSQTGWWCDSRWALACSCSPTNDKDSRCESCMAGVVQQRPAESKHLGQRLSIEF